jgi:hypothetical protein
MMDVGEEERGGKQGGGCWKLRPLGTPAQGQCRSCHRSRVRLAARGQKSVRTKVAKGIRKQRSENRYVKIVYGAVHTHHIHTQVHTYICMCVCVCVCMCMCVYMCMYVFMCIRCALVCVCVYVCARVHACMLWAHTVKKGQYDERNQNRKNRQ